MTSLGLKLLSNILRTNGLTCIPEALSCMTRVVSDSSIPNAKAGSLVATFCLQAVWASSRPAFAAQLFGELCNPSIASPSENIGNLRANLADSRLTYVLHAPKRFRHPLVPFYS